MRFNTRVELFKLAQVPDGAGGYKDEYQLIDDKIYVNSSYLSSRYCLEVFGYASTTALTLICRQILNFDKKEKYKIKIMDTSYSILDYKIIKNRTRLIVEVIDID